MKNKNYAFPFISGLAPIVSGKNSLVVKGALSLIL